MAHHMRYQAGGTVLGDESDNLIDRLILIVTGGHLQAEMRDRPLAYALQKTVENRLSQQTGGDRLKAAVCSDMWYLNDETLLERPVICVGRPGVNAASALYAVHLPGAYVIDELLQIQMEPELTRLQACLWGVDATATARAVEIFNERYLDEFLATALMKP